ncbi:hypothetical protein Poli38472_007984 [Pythium oligandrum]|uniref:J domain-containing protein n=1 Tax=Pythium oligandrum TaxID=41045 RepID=A0A8K1FMZ3_PYTOL|nr:hypothetical protein Poli38472_007984 [Pythium oligandrum]|eukprot:TMW65342.1 hypothetical protein Poli38472_007984 [Pythium oligandrum]
MRNRGGGVWDTKQQKKRGSSMPFLEPQQQTHDKRRADESQSQTKPRKRQRRGKPVQEEEENKEKDGNATSPASQNEKPVVSGVSDTECRAMEHLDSDDYFEVLGLARTATEADVKKAYRKLAIQWHPDKNRSDPKAEEYFKKIAEAYEVLSDPEKRRVYERYGKKKLEETGGEHVYEDHFGYGGRAKFSSRHARDIFEAFFGGVDPFEAFFGEQRRRSQQRGRRSVFDDDDGGFGMMGGGFGMHMMGGGGFGMMHGFGGSGRRSGGFGMMDSFFNDDFGGFGSMGGSSSFSQSVSTSSYTDRSGQTVTKKTTTTVNPDGRTETITEEYRNGKLVNSNSNSSTRLADAGRMQLEGGSSRTGSSRERLASAGSARVRSRRA